MVGALSSTCFKFGRWVDAVLMQRILGEGDNSLPPKQPGRRKSRAKRSAADQFMPIGYFPDFEKHVESRNIKEKADKKAGDMKSVYKEIERQYEWRGWNRWFRNLVSGTAGLISLIVWLVFVFGGLFAVYYFRAQIWDTIAGILNSR